MKKFVISGLVLLYMFLCMIPPANAESSIVPTSAVSNIPVASITNMSEGRDAFTIFNTISASATIHLELKRGSRVIKEDNNEFTLVYDIKKENGKRYLEYESCEGIVRKGFLGDINVYTTDDDYIPAELIVRQLAIYRLIALAKEYGADAVLTPTIITTATASKKHITYKAEISAKLIKIKND